MRMITMFALFSILFGVSVRAEIVEMRYKGPFISDTTIPGEQKSDWISPSHPYCMRLSEDRWFIIFATRGFTGMDDDRSILYQIRSEAPDGPVICEGILRKATSRWNRLGIGETIFKAHGTPVAFGVPKGAVRDGKSLPNSNVFVATWYTYDKIEKDIEAHKKHIIDEDLVGKTLHIEWMQFCLNEAEDNIRLLAPISQLRQKGYETGEVFCSMGPSAGVMNHWVMPTAIDEEGSEWLECAAIGGKIAIIGYAFNPQTRLYEWTKTSPSFQDSERGLSEASIVRFQDDWLLCARTTKNPGATAWLRTKDFFAGFGEPVYVAPQNISPRTAYLCPDGVLRIFCGDRKASPYGTKRNPLFCWDVDPKDFSISNRRVVLDTIKEKLGIEKPMVGFAKLFPPQGKRQIVTYRVMAPKTNVWPYREDGQPAITRQELMQMGSHYSEIIYDAEAPEQWEFGDTR